MPHREFQVIPEPQHLFRREKKGEEVRQEKEPEPRSNQYYNSVFLTPLMAREVEELYTEE